MSSAPTPAAVGISKNIQAGMPKNMVLDLRWFDSDQMKLEDWWRGIRLFLKSIRVIETNDRIMAILAHLRGCYELKSLGLDKKTNSCIKVNIRELNKEFFTK